MKTKKGKKLPFGVDRPEQSPGFMFWQTTMVWQRHIKKLLEPYDVSHAQFVILATLRWFEGHGHVPTQVHVIEWTQLDKMTVSKSLMHLVAKDLVTRNPDEADARAKNVYLTLKGMALVDVLVPLVENMDQSFFNRLAPGQQAQLMNILSQLSSFEGNPNAS